MLHSASSKSPFAKYEVDFSPAQGRTVEDHLARIRAQIVRVLESFGMTPEPPRFGAIHSIRVTLAFVRIAIQETRPAVLAGYGEIPPHLLPELNGLITELEGLVDRLDCYIGGGPDLQERMSRIATDTNHAGALKHLGDTIQKHGLVELRPSLEAILDRMEDQRLEIAVFGQVSCGKSSLLNHILGADILPVGATPITAVPTRLLFGPEPRLRVAFAGYKGENFPLPQLSEFVTEQQNPANTKGVWKVQVEYPAPRLREGVVFVDTPGLGSLATAGSQQTLAYLPNCDLGVVMVNSSSSLTPGDVRTVQMLHESGAAVRVVLSKVDLLSRADVERSLRYVHDKLVSDLNLEVAVAPISTVGDHEALLDRWFEQEIAPLQEKHKQLAEVSLHRKIESLRYSVDRGLESVRRRSEAVPPDQLAHLQRVEVQLRRAAGEFQTAEAACLKTCDEIRQLAPVALRWAARQAVQYWTGDTSSRLPSGFVRDAVITSAITVAREMVSALEELARNLNACLRETSDAIAMDRAGLPDDLAGLVRGMPQIDLYLDDPDVARPFVLRINQRLAEAAIERKLQDVCGAAVHEAFSSHGRLLEAWLRRTLLTLQHRFDMYADGYRAQLGRILAPR
ncbi:MAG: dynamin family protein [Acidobacteria bacterium]|nr:dynamin family protein [Acidobacteriota bacterium]